MDNKITFVCCIEYGKIEEQALLMLRSFRKNAGRLKNSRILAIQPRTGAQLKNSTIQELKELSVELIIDYKVNSITWFNYANKVAAVKITQELANTDLIAWLDSDILVADEPTELLLNNDTDFAARAEFLPPAIRGHNTTHIPYWEALCNLLEVDFADLPILYVDHRDEHIKMYFNSGVFVWRRQTDFAETYFNAFVKLLKSRIAQYDGNFFTADQVILGPVLLKLKLSWQHLSYYCHHMTFQSQIDSPIASPHMGNSSLIHYSKSLSPEYRQRFLNRSARELPQLHAFVVTELKKYDEEKDSDKINDYLALIYRVARGLRWKYYALTVKKVAKG